MSDGVEEQVIGYTLGDLDTGFKDVCCDCIDGFDESLHKHALTDSERYGAVVSYPECDGCGEKMMPSK